MQMVQQLDAQLVPPRTVQCLTGGGTACARWLTQVETLVGVSLSNYLDQNPVGSRVREIVDQVVAHGDAYAREGCAGEETLGKVCTEQASGIVVGAKVLAQTLRAEWQG
jgi:hypothetical protein